MPGTQVRQEWVAKARRIVVKVGTQTVCHEKGGVNLRAVADLAGEIAAIRKSGVEVLLVASGAIGAGLAEMHLPDRPRTMPQLQAVAAVGQGQLMRAIHDVFRPLGVPVAQVLLTREDFEHRQRYLNIRNTLSALGRYGALPVVNENDTVAVDEIRFGENDILAAILAGMIGADLLVLLTNVDGVLKDGAVVDVIEQVDEKTLALASGERSRLGSGGMASKLTAAGLVARAGAAAVIANAREPRVLARLLAGEKIGTVFVPARRRMSGRRRWLDQVLRPAGRIVVDDGAARALCQLGKSLLPSGVTAVSGRFEKGATIAVFDTAGREIARGLTNYSSEQMDRIKGLKTSQLAKVLGPGEKTFDEVIHRNNMTVR